MAQRIEGKLQSLHTELINKIQINNKAAKDRPRAAEMEKVLYQIKNLNRTPTNAVEGLLDEQAQILIDEALGILNSNREAKNRLSGKELFHRAHKRASTSFGGDDIFEEEFAATLTAIEQQATGRSVDISQKLVGGQAANILIDEVGKDVEKFMNKYVESITKRISNTENQKERHWVKPVARSGKVDVNGITPVDVSAELNPKWEQLYKLFSGCTFSVKNYSSYYTKSLDIHLGNTDIYKALYGVLSKVIGDSNEINSIIHAGLRSYDASGNKTVATHFYHMRYIYELTGVGLYDENGYPISGVDFLIYNDPNSDAIFVRSTADMIAQELEKEHRTSPFGGIKVAKADFNSDKI